MEPVTIQEKIRTNTIPGQVVGALQNYAESVSAVQSALFNTGKVVVVVPADTAGTMVFEHKEIPFSAKGRSTVFYVRRTSTGQLVGANVPPITNDLRMEASGFLIKEFNAIASKLALESAVAHENRETTRAIGATVLIRTSAAKGKTKVTQRTPVICRSTARSLLKYATGWAGDELPALMNEVRKTRTESSF